MWCEMADTRKNWQHILKGEKCMEYDVNPFFVREQENDFPSKWMVYRGYLLVLVGYRFLAHEWS